MKRVWKPGIVILAMIALVGCGATGPITGSAARKLARESCPRSSLSYFARCVIRLVHEGRITATPAQLASLERGSTAVEALQQLGHGLKHVANTMNHAVEEFNRETKRHNQGPSESTPSAESAGSPVGRPVFFRAAPHVECQVTPRRSAYCQIAGRDESVTLMPSGRLTICRTVGCVGNGPDGEMTLHENRQVTVRPFVCVATPSETGTPVVGCESLLATDRTVGFVLGKDGVEPVQRHH